MDMNWKTSKGWNRRNSTLLRSKGEGGCIKRKVTTWQNAASRGGGRNLERKKTYDRYGSLKPPMEKRKENENWISGLGFRCALTQDLSLERGTEKKLGQPLSCTKIRTRSWKTDR